MEVEEVEEGDEAAAALLFGLTGSVVRVTSLAM
jgi:hypothetical protein